VKKAQLHKALNVIHGEVFGVSKKINIAIFGHGGVGGALINQILKSKNDIEKRKGINLNVFAIANSKKLLLNKQGVNANWEQAIIDSHTESSVNDVILFAKNNHLENLIAVDNTASGTFHNNYKPLVEAGFDLVSSNKIANTISHAFYKDLRVHLKEH
ncbi:bifunctional aspartate kinase/homoserine dehydrogenase I, partial [Seonamhaeicola marinus]